MDDKEKTEWIIKTLEHTKGKDYENYVVTGIWHRLVQKKIELKPVTQQYVRRNKGYALLDLYFPAINFAIECDERQHFDRKSHEYNEKDKSRERDILQKLGALEKPPQIEKIDVTKTIQEIDVRLDEVTKIIIEKVDKYKCTKWDIDPIQLISQKRKICVYDNLMFSKKIDVLKALDVRNSKGQLYKSFQSGLLYDQKRNRYLWFPKINIERKHKDWENILIDKTHIIEECNKAKIDKIWEKRSEDFDENKIPKYLVFAKIQNSLGQNGYKYLGTFKMESYDYSKRPFITKWKRIKTKEKI